jgi:hypothetical protein
MRIPGFGLSFYGFFAFAMVWVVCYFLWAYVMARKDRHSQGPNPPEL